MSAIVPSVSSAVRGVASPHGCRGWCPRDRIPGRPVAATLASPNRRAHLVSVRAAAAYDTTWSNPSGAVLTPLVDDLVWAAERPFLWNSIDVGGKMGVVRLSDGSLWVHSPVDLDSPTRAAVDALGPVRHIVSPNFEHVKWAAQWKRAYPSATLWGCPGMREKKPDIPWDDEVGRDDADPPEWLDEFKLAWFDSERNPFVGGAFFNEVVFAHGPSRTLFVTDLFWNYPGGGDVPLGTRAWKFGMDVVYLPFYKRAMVDDANKYEATVERVCAWDFEAMLPCHGSFVPSGAKRVVRKHLAL